VQFGSISKFGLLEMSRQRLKPALNEGASIPCPRCGGSGHIRDTESSALQILRIIQEESLKDSTAAVLVQVPVEVASFLLNEKRTEITKIELKQRISVLLVPNKSLDTPNYKLERLKHDDPRLDNLDASYKLADEVDDVASFTRRSQERTNKQEPVIKGVLPDGPAPVAAPRPETPAPAAAPVAAPVAAKAVPAAPAPAEKGFFGWLKSLFGAEPAPAKPAATPAVTAPAAKGGAREERADGGRREGGRDGRSRGGRGGAEGRGSREGREGGGRNGGRGGEGRAVEARAEGGRVEGRNEQARGEGRRGEGRGEGRNENRGEGRNENRNEGRGGEGRQGNRREGGRREAPVAAEGGNVNNALPLDAAPGDTPEAAEGQQRRDRDRRPRGDNRRRQPGAEGAEAAPRPDAVEGEQPATVAEGVSEAQAPREGDAENGAPRGNRERRSRDRYGRDRRERGPREGVVEGEEASAAAETVAPAERSEAVSDSPDASAYEAPVRSYFSMATPPAVNAETTEAPAAEPVAVAPAEVVVPTPVAAPAAEVAAPAPAVVPEAPRAPRAAAPVAAAAPRAVEAPGSRGLPKVQPFTLSVESLDQVAQASGLEWVNSNAEKVAQVQAAIAAEPKPIHVPREPKPPVVLDEGPLVLVETRKDLRDMKLPFENP
jgi:ribonuclease E